MEQRLTAVGDSIAISAGLEIPEDHQVKEIYAEIAKRTGGDWRAAERSLRYGIQ